MSTKIKTQEKLASLKQFNCKNCGNALSVLHPRAKFIVCKFCGSQLEADSEEHQILTQAGVPDRHPPFSFIKLGQKAVFEGIAYQVISRTRWKMDYMEYWSDEDGSGYSKEVWIYDEWLLLSEHYTYIYLVEDRSGYSLVDEIIPEFPQLRSSNMKMKFFEKQRNRRIQEYGHAKTIFFEGESNYQIKRGDSIEFTMFKDWGIDYLAEWRVDPVTKKIKEIEFFKETPVSKPRLLEAFSMNPEVLEVKKRYEFWGFVKKLALLSVLGMVLLLLYAAFSGREIHKEVFSVSDTLNGEVTSQPIQVSSSGLYRLRLRAEGLANEMEIYVFAYILNQDSVPINTLDTDFYYYTGVDSDGTWTEADTKSSNVFKIKEAGTYYVQLYTNQERVASYGTLELSLLKGIWIKRYFIIGLIGFIIMWVFAYIKQHYS